MSYFNNGHYGNKSLTYFFSYLQVNNRVSTFPCILFPLDRSLWYRMSLNGFLLKPRFCTARRFGCPEHPQPRRGFLWGGAHNTQPALQNPGCFWLAPTRCARRPSSQLLGMHCQRTRRHITEQPTVTKAPLLSRLVCTQTNRNVRAGHFAWSC